MQKGSKIKDLVRAAVFAAISFFAFASAQGQWLYWKVDFNVTGVEELNPPWTSSDDPYVWLVAIDSAGNKKTLTGQNEAGSSVTYIQLEKAVKQEGGQWGEKEYAMKVALDQLGTLSPSADAYSFYIEMGNYINGVEDAKYESTKFTFQELKNMDYIHESANFSNTGFWNPALTYGFTKVVPEPTGGMLFGFGLCLLALRRRRKRGAA